MSTNLNKKYTPLVYYIECVCCDFMNCASTDVKERINYLQSYINDVDYEFTKDNIAQIYSLFLELKHTMSNMTDIDEDNKHLLDDVIENIITQWN